MKSALVDCQTCMGKIAKTAQSCPACGAKNEWVHPVFKLLKDSPHIFDGCNTFEYQMDSFSITGHAPKASYTRQMKLMHLGLKIMLAAVLVLFFSPGLASLTLIIGVAVSLFGQIVGGTSVNSLDAFKLDLSTDEFRWQSNDDEHWRPVRDVFEKAWNDWRISRGVTEPDDTTPTA